MSSMFVLIIVLWSLFGFNLVADAAPYCKNLGSAQKILVCIIFLIGGPLFAFTGILETIVRCILPEDWDNDDENDNGRYDKFRPS